MAMGHITKLVGFSLLGIAIGAYWPLMLTMIGTAVIGTWYGRRALDHMPERAFRIVFQILLTGLALRLIWVGASGV